jgi:hypothetical protein
MVRLQVVLNPTEADVLAQWAASELRDPRDQIRFVLRQELEKRGLLQPAERCTENKAGGDGDDS